MRRDWSAARAKVDEESRCRNCATRPGRKQAAKNIPDRDYLTPVEQARAVVDAGGLITALRRITNERNPSR